MEKEIQNRAARLPYQVFIQKISSDCDFWKSFPSLSPQCNAATSVSRFFMQQEDYLRHFQWFRWSDHWLSNCHWYSSHHIFTITVILLCFWHLSIIAHFLQQESSTLRFLRKFNMRILDINNFSHRYHHVYLWVFLLDSQ